jgi:hypothetical protein
MTDKSKFEQMLEKLVADDKTAAEEIFHNIVVEKSRSIYEGLLEDDIKDIEVEETSKEESKEKSDETTEASKEDKKEDEKVEEKTEETKDEETTEASKDDAKEDEAVEEASKDEESKDEDTTDESLVDVQDSEAPAVETPVVPAEMGGDATDDMMGDIEADKGEEDKEGDADHDGEDMEDRVVDLEDAIDDLKAEFEKMMSDKGDDEEGDDDAEDKGEEEAIISQDAEGETEVAPVLAPEEVAPAVESKESAPKSATEEIREYVNKVEASHSDGSDNTASPVAKSGGTDAKADAKGLVQGGEEKGRPAPKAKEHDGGNINKPGNKSAAPKAAKANTADGTDGSSKKSAIGS